LAASIPEPAVALLLSTAPLSLSQACLPCGRPDNGHMCGKYGQSIILLLSIMFVVSLTMSRTTASAQCG